VDNKSRRTSLRIITIFTLFFMSLFESDVYWQVAAICVGVVECDICRCSVSICDVCQCSVSICDVCQCSVSICDVCRCSASICDMCRCSVWICDVCRSSVSIFWVSVYTFWMQSSCSIYV
jgi:hypothetical protein